MQEQFALTPRQLEIVNLMLSGLANKEIGARLFIAEKTVKYHITNIFKACRIKRRKDLHGIVDKITQSGVTECKL